MFLHTGHRALKLLLSQAPQVLMPSGRSVALSPRDGALLAWLALEGPTSRARLAQLLWPDTDADAARNVLRQRLFKLRKAAGFDLVQGSATLALAEGLAHDLEDADAVLGQAPGEDLAPGEFAQWLEQQRARRRDRVRRSLVELSEMAEGARDWDDALTHAKELLALEPLNEDAHRRVMRLHYLAGDRVAALLAFDRCEQLLKEEIGAKPSPETLALLATLELAVAPAAAVAVPRVPASVQRPPRLVGREATWRMLEDAWQERRSACVRGDGGMGKTRLLSDFAGSRAGVLIAGARPGDAQVVHATASRLLRQVPRAVIDACEAGVRSELAALLPELGPAAPARGGEQRTRFFNAVAALLDSPALALQGVVVDDLHLADDASVELLQYVAAQSPRRWLFAARAAELRPAARALLDALGEGLVPVEVEPLALAQVVELLDSLAIEGLDSAAVAPALLRHTGGNPQYMLETLKAWLAQGGAIAQTLRLPAVRSVAALIERRIGQLSTPAVQLARCAAVASPDFSIELASRVLGVRTLDLADPWAELEAAQVLRDGAFAHDLIYESALASVPAAVARQLHAEIAAFLDERGGEPARMARHWMQAQHWPAAGRAFVAAADRARDASRLLDQCALLAQAAHCFEQAGQRDERFDALLERARTLASNDLGPDAHAAVQALDQLAGNDLQRLLALDARLELAMSRYEISDALRLGAQGIAGAQALGRRDLELRFAIVLSGALCDARQPEEAVALLEPHAAWIAAQGDPAQQWEYWEARALALDYANRLGDAMPAWEAARAVAQKAGRRDMLWKTMSNTASTQAKMGLVRQAAQAAEQAHRLALASSEALSLRLLQMQVTLAHRLRDVGRYGQALALLEQALAGFEARGGSHSDQALAEQRLVVLYQQLGQWARVVPLLAAERPGVPLGVAMIRLAHRAELEAQMGRDGVPMMREALRMIPSADDIYHRITTLFAARLLPPDEGEALAAGLALWASARERHGVALSGHVCAAACALAQDAAGRGLPHVEAALRLARHYLPDSFYLPQLWLVAARTMSRLGRDDAAARAVAEGSAWVRQVHDASVPPEFRDSFLQRNAVNRDLLALAAASGA